MGFLDRLFPPLEYDGDCRLHYRDRNEELVYVEGGEQRAVVELTGCRGRRIYPDSLTWEGERPDAEEQARVFGNMLVFLCGRRNRKLIVVINVDDPRRSLWEGVCAAKRELAITFESSSDEEELAFELRSMLEVIEGGGTVQFGVDGAPTRSREEIESEMARRLDARQREREQQRAELEG